MNLPILLNSVLIYQLDFLKESLLEISKASLMEHALGFSSGQCLDLMLVLVWVAKLEWVTNDSSECL